MGWRGPGRSETLSGMPMHADQLPVTAEMVRRLVAHQFPPWAERPIVEVTSHGTVNALFRIGAELVARFPLRAGEVEATRRELTAEADAAQELVGRTPFATPRPVAIGGPGFGYPMAWSVQTWLPGTTADEVDASGSTAYAEDLASFIAGVRSIDTRGRVFAGRGRGGDLHAEDPWVETCFRRSEDLLDVPRLRRRWAALRELPRRAPDAMTHGDLIPGNVLVADGRLVGVIDVGGLGAADPALDLVAAWHLLDRAPRDVLRATLGADDLEWARGQGWAFAQAMGLVWYYVDTNPVMSRLGRTALARILADPAV
jgi:aminoglycoside phosphotransferase (APT) family kinase protein